MENKTYKIICLFLYGISTAILFGNDTRWYQTIASDGVPWRTSLPRRQIFLGDIHADYAAVTSVYAHLGLIDPHTLRWTGKDTKVLGVGDLFDRYDETRLVQDFLIRMDVEARAAGGSSRHLLGNHDSIPIGGSVGPLDWTSDKDMAGYQDYQNTPYADALVKTGAFSRLQAGFLAANHEDTPFAKWNRSKNAIEIIGDNLIVHAGLDEWALRFSPEEINATVRAWVGALQGVREAPPLNTSWVLGFVNPPQFDEFFKKVLKEVGYPLAFAGMIPPAMKAKIDGKNACDVLYGVGPLWSSVTWRDPIDENLLDKIMKKYGVKRVIVGHTRMGQIETKYHGKVYNIDTNMGRSIASGNIGSMLSALEIVDGKVIKHENIPMKILPERYDREVSLREECQHHFAQLLQAVP